MENDALLKEVTAKAQVWLGEGYDEETRAAVKAMLDNPDHTELIESFYRDLEFGTGGLRGIMGAGTNRMNIYTVGAEEKFRFTSTYLCSHRTRLPKQQSPFCRDFGRYILS